MSTGSGTTAASRRRTRRLLEEQGVTDVTTGELQRGGQALETLVERSPSSIGTSALRDEPSFKLPDLTATTETAGLLGAISQGSDNFTENLQRRADEARQKTGQSLTDLVTMRLQQPTETEAQIAAEEEVGLPGIEQELLAINQEIREEQRALENQLRDIEDLGGGLVSGQNIEMQRVRGESLRRQADLFVIQQGVQGRFDSAKAISDRAVKARMEQQRQITDTLQFIYDENKDLFTTAEQRAFEATQADRNRRLDAEEEEIQQISDLSVEALRNEAPASVVRAMREAESVTEALAIGGGYIGLLERNAANRAAASANLARRLQLYELAEKGDPEAVKELGFDPTDQPITPEKLLANEQEYARLGTTISTVDKMLNNERGFNLSTGVAQGRLELLGRSFSPIQAVQIPKMINERNDFLNNAKFVVDNLTFDKLIDLKSQGATFGALSDNELRSIGNAADRLGSMAIKDESGNIVGFSGSPSEVTEQLNFIKEKMKKAQDTTNISTLSDSDKNEIFEIYNE